MRGDPDLPEREATRQSGPAWATVEQMLRALGVAQPYVVLRNFEGMPDSLVLVHHDDLDLLVEHADDAARVLHAWRVFPEPYRRQYEVRINGRALRVDLRSLDDGYFDPAWQRAVLARRTTIRAGIYVPCPTDAFWTLLYHALTHKPVLSVEYGERLAAMAIDLEISYEEPLQRTEAWKLLYEEMARQGWRFTEPDDLSVWFHQDAWSYVYPRVRRVVWQTYLRSRRRLRLGRALGRRRG